MITATGTFIEWGDTPKNRKLLRDGLWLTIIDQGLVVDPVVVDEEVIRLAPYVNTTGGSESVKAYILVQRVNDEYNRR